MKSRNKFFILEFFILVVACTLNRGLLLGLLWVILHEMAHIIVSIKYNIQMEGMQVHITGAKANIYEIDKLEDNKKILLYAIGPLVNLFLVIIMLILNKYYKSEFIIESIRINIVLFVFNMLPAYPLDGGRICEVIIGKKFSYRNMKNIVIFLSYSISIILTLLFFLTIYIHKVNVSILVTAILITYSTYLEKKNIMYILMGSLINKGKWLSNRGYIENRNICIYHKTTLIKAMSLVDRNRFNSFLVLNEGLQVLGIVHEVELMEALKKYGNLSFGEYLQYKDK